eukprot:TRINITY_DN18957_c0_g1_i1.p1 TRINITY_DN18957_c0_g1~~TRINITY_DN18957_c0_g1_i1.p1  ORF type:complete len:830 (+),score=130.38 TRINITY_DN18957_c0_g1_i1:56-2491(+)
MTTGASRVYEYIFGSSVRTILLDSDSEEERMRKWVIFPFCMITTVLICAIVVDAGANEKYPSFVLDLTMLVILVAEAFRILITKVIHRFNADLLMFTSSVFVLLQDWVTHGMHGSWIGITLLMDVCLLVQCSSTCTRVIQTLTICYLIAKMIEEAEGVGIYDVFPNNTGISKREPIGWFVSSLTGFTRMYIFLGDYALTRWFAEGMRSERLKANDAVKLTESVAVAMAKFDLATAEELVDRDREGIHCAFVELLANLQMYEPFLPDSVLHRHASRAVSLPGPIPGKQNNIAAIVCTGIEHISTMWECLPIITRKAVQTYRRVIRDVLSRYVRGSEIKNSSETFMLAFDTAADAVSYCLDVHAAMQKQEWDAELLQLDCFKRSTNSQSGPLVRIAVHYGPVEIEQWNKWQVDYWGPAITIAANLEHSKAIGGTTVVTDAVLHEINRGMIAQPFIIPAGLNQSTGNTRTSFHVSELYFLVNSEFPERKRETEKALRQRIQSSATLQNSTSSAQSHFNRLTEGVGGLVSLNELHAALQCQLQKKKSVTMGHVRVAFSCLNKCSDPIKPVNDIISCVVESLNRTDGTIVTLSGMAVTCSWNVSRSGSGHQFLSVKFAGVVHRDIDSRSQENSMWPGRINIGLVTGSVLHGNVGTPSHKFAVVIGACSEASVILAETAAEYGVFVMHASLPEHPPLSCDPAMTTLCRPIGRWSLTTSASHSETVILHQLREHRLIDGVLRLAAFIDDPKDDWEWSTSYCNAYINEDIMTLSGYDGDDGVLKMAIAILSQKDAVRKLCCGHTASEANESIETLQLRP